MLPSWKHLTQMLFYVNQNNDLHYPFLFVIVAMKGGKKYEKQNKKTGF